ncbi:diguanylate cyclase [Paludibacterium yongneupense]|uniref:diguanylate cyclase n=1 Tax=Paludibacterium yongneupense TaxID=400061 RepID=UPI0004153CC5|nr:diguanylate cyclase [Paludibacterium yongneupense]
MTAQREAFLAEVSGLIGDPAHAAHPLREALQTLYQLHTSEARRLERQLEKIIRISDQSQQMLREMNERLKWLSSHDELTGLYNRRFARAELDRALRRIVPGTAVFCLVLADIDHFKSINDHFGHDIGDKALSAISTCLAHHVGEDGLCSRWGGEEFLLLFPGLGLDATRQRLQRLHAAVADIRGVLPDDERAITVSFGLSCCNNPDEEGDLLLKRVDLALYEAKRKGRNRTEAIVVLDTAHTM